MSFLIAKDFRRPGCVAMPLYSGDDDVALIRDMDESFGHEYLQLVKISRPSAYGEYEPYEFVKTAEEMRSAVRAWQDSRKA